MRPDEHRRARAAATAVAVGLGLAVDDAVVLQDSNRLTLRLLPADVVARTSPRDLGRSDVEVALARGLAAAGAPVAALDPRVEPRPYEADGFVVTLWTHHPSIGPPSPAALAAALVRLHAGLATLDVPTQHVTDRAAEAEALLASPVRTPALVHADRVLLVDALHELRRAVLARGAPEQLLHGEPHPGNVINTADRLRFIDLETCCRGPIEVDLSYLPEAISRRYPDVDDGLLQDCRGLALAMVAAWRWDAADTLPDGRRAGHDLVRALRRGPPWPTLDELTPPIGLSRLGPSGAAGGSSARPDPSARITQRKDDRSPQFHLVARPPPAVMAQSPSMSWVTHPCALARSGRWS